MGQVNPQVKVTWVGLGRDFSVFIGLVGLGWIGLTVVMMMMMMMKRKFL